MSTGTSTHFFKIDPSGTVVETARGHSMTEGHPVSPEFTFIPNTAPYEIVDKKAGEQLAKRIMEECGVMTELVMRAKRDLFHNAFSTSEDPGERETYCIEITPLWQWQTDWLADVNVQGAIDRLFKWLREECGLVPYMTTMENGVEHHWPTGGCHIHYGAGLFGGSWWFQDMEHFNQNLMTDLANRPYCRWLFSEAWDDLNHCSLVQRRNVGIAAQNPEWVAKFAEKQSTLIPRWMIGNGKQRYFTYEFRANNMIRSGHELYLIILFLDAWMQSHVKRVTEGRPKVEFTLTEGQWSEMATIRGGWRYVSGWLRELGLLPADYRPFFERNYITRVRFGNMD